MSPIYTTRKAMEQAARDKPAVKASPATETSPVQKPDKRILQRASELSTLGLNLNEVEDMLVKEGVAPDQAAKAARSYAYMMSLDRDERESGDDNGGGTGKMITGAIMVIGGIISSVVSYRTAGPGDMIYLAIGVVLGGIALFIKGLFDRSDIL